MKRFFTCLALVTLFVLSFPAFFSTESRNLTGTSQVAFAGRSVPHKALCQPCGTATCLCEPGEEPCTLCPTQGIAMQPSTEPQPLDVDLGSSITLIVAAVLLVLRLRQF